MHACNQLCSHVCVYTIYSSTDGTSLTTALLHNVIKVNRVAIVSLVLLCDNLTRIVLRANIIIEKFCSTKYPL